MWRASVLLIAVIASGWTTVSEPELYHNYRKAIKHESTFQYFVVIRLADANTGAVREVCTTGDLLEGAIHREYNLGYDIISQARVKRIALSNRSRLFRFRSAGAIENLGTLPYSMDDLRAFESRIRIEEFIGTIGKAWKMPEFSEAEMVLLAHALFNRGVLTRENSCRGGTLEIVGL